MDTRSTDDRRLDFYNQIFSWFGDSLKVLKTDKNLKEFSSEIIQNSLIELLTRTIFVWFIKEHRLKERISSDYFDPENWEDPRKDYFYKNILKKTLAGHPNSPPRMIETFLCTYLDVPCLGLNIFKEFKEDVILPYPEHIFTSPSHGLFYILDKFDYTSDEYSADPTLIDPEMIGKIFENSLSLLSSEGEDNKRKTTGSYYTPREIVDYMSRESINHYLHQHTDIPSNIISDLIVGGKLNLTDDQRETLRSKITVMRVLDPAVGSGAFPVGILNLIVKILSRLEGGWNSTLYDKYSSIMRDKIFGIDIQPIAIQICKLRMYLILILSRKKEYGEYPQLDYNFVTGDFLKKFEGIPEKYDLIVGNPPYIRQEKINHLKEYLKKSYKIYDGTADIYTYFFEKSIKMLEDKGHCCLIVSNKWMRAKYGGKLRKYLKEFSTLKIIIDFKGEQIFESASVDTCIVLTCKELRDKSEFGYAHILPARHMALASR